VQINIVKLSQSIVGHFKKNKKADDLL